MKDDGVPIPTNVFRIYNALNTKAPAGNEQKQYYHSGVGTSSNILDKITGGTVGKGLSNNIQSAYKWLSDNYMPDDRIFLFGFSRGAYTVRSLAGMIKRAGLLKPDAGSGELSWDDVKKAFDKRYREALSRNEWADGLLFHENVKIHFLGVWDTVGALGIPEDYAILSLFNDSSEYRFLDTELDTALVCHARHAVAVDEMRESFMPTLWTDSSGNVISNIGDKDSSVSVKQIWFPGVHCDVGGSYPETGLSDGALKWMMDEASAKGLAFMPHILTANSPAGRIQVNPDFQAVMHDSLTGAFKHLRTQPRNVPEIKSANAGLFHDSVLNRQIAPPITQASYHQLAELPVNILVFAREHWNETGIYLEAGKNYTFEASGEWLDWDIKFSPDGKNDHFHIEQIGMAAGSVLGKLEHLLKCYNEHVDLIGTKRHEDIEWLALVGAITNSGNPTKTGTAASLEYFKIGTGISYTPKKSGYLYCYANDSWFLYDNNRGCVKLTVSKTSSLS